MDDSIDKFKKGLDIIKDSLEKIEPDKPNVHTLNKLVKKYNINNDDLIKFCTTCQEIKKLGLFDFLKKEKLKVELFKTKKKYGVGFMDNGLLIRCCENLTEEEVVERIKQNEQQKIENEKRRLQKEEHKEKIRLQNEKDRELKQKWKEENDRLKKEKWLKKQEEKRIKEIKRKEVLKKDISDISKEFDTDSDGIIDFNQGQDDFMNLLKKHQVSIIEIDQNHITKFIQVSNYLKTKRENIQKQFEKIKTSKNTYQLKEFTGVLKNQIDTFNLLSYNSMIMIISLVEKDLLTFNEIYLTLDKLNIFNSNWENEVSNKLENIGSKLDDLMFSINKMEISITNEILKMSIMNQINLNRLNKTVSQGNMMINDSLKSLNSSLSSNLKSIGSKLNLNNLLTGINTYQLYTLNKNTKSLRS